MQLSFAVQGLSCFLRLRKRARPAPAVIDGENLMGDPVESVWINIYEAITHNEEVMANSPKKGGCLSSVRPFY